MARTQALNEIFSGIDKFPSPKNPGSMIVTGDSMPIVAFPKAGDVIFSVAAYGSGRICCFAHTCHLDPKWFSGDELRTKFDLNVKKWLTRGRFTGDHEIGSLKKLSVVDDLGKFKLLIWHHEANVKGELQQKVLGFLRNGGGLICASTPWGYCQTHHVDNLNGMSLYHFLKTNFGIFYKTNNLWLPIANCQIDLNSNKAEDHSNFQKALSQLSDPNAPFDQICSTLAAGVPDLHREGFITDSDFDQIDDAVSKLCSCSNFNLVPSSSNPVCEANMKYLVSLLGVCYSFKNGRKAPGIEDFPGDFDEPPCLLKNVKVNLQTQFKERLSTGYYLPAGVALVLEVLKENPSQGLVLNHWNVLIGAHSDDLTRCKSFKRWPRVTISKPLEHHMTIFSPFGGLIYLESGQGGSISFILNNVVESPYFDLTRPETVADWNRRRQAAGLWAELAGEHIIFTTPSRCFRNLENPTDILKFWDQVVRTHHECRGTRAADFRRERIVNDAQPSVGYMHAGYPIVTYLDCCESSYEECIFDLEKLKKNGCWGLFHELGHNMQRDEWTFDGCREVTVNIFSMHATTFVIGQEVIEQKWPTTKKRFFDKFFSKQPTYDDWRCKCEMALMTFVQLIKHFGWEPMRKFMRDYENDMATNREALPKTNQEKIDQWVIRYSKIVKRNIKPQFEMYGLPVSSSVDLHVGEFSPFSPINEKNPDDFFSSVSGLSL